MGRQVQERERLQTELEEILGSRNVYFQPPPSLRMHYPAIVYSRNRIASLNADNEIYKTDVQYLVTVIDEDPDSEIVERLSYFRNARHDRHYESDGLNHDVFTIYMK